MGQEIVYCVQCAVRINGGDFEKGKAFRTESLAVCADCLPDLLPTLSPEDRKAIVPPGMALPKKSSSTQVRAVKPGKVSGGVASARSGKSTGAVPIVKTGKSSGNVPAVRTG